MAQPWMWMTVLKKGPGQEAVRETEGETEREENKVTDPRQKDRK